jgi:pyroglutamyl-peptidase
MARPRILITGFGPFPGAAENPSAWLAPALASAAPSGWRVRSDVLPTEWDAVAARAPRLLEKHRPRFIVHFGLSKSARGFRIERSAHNVLARREDACGALPAMRSVLDFGAARLDTSISAASLARYLRSHRLPASASRSAGAYLCNYLYYLSLQWAKAQTACDAIFVHLPPGPRQAGPLSEAQMLRGAKLILERLVARAKEGDQADVVAARAARAAATAARP